MKFTKNFFHDRQLKKLVAEIERINDLEKEFADFSLEKLKEESELLKKSVKESGDLESVLSRAFALVREAAKRTLNQRPFDVQLMGGIVIHQGGIAEMVTGEGKTLSAVAPVYLNALSGKGVHVVTVNDYLARRDAVWMGQIYYFLGLKISCLVPNGAFIYDPDWKIPTEEKEVTDEERDEVGSFLVKADFLRPVSRKEAYGADIVYGPNHEFGFDYLRDNLAYNEEGQVQRDHYFAIIDEVDSILIDEARTPLIIAAPDQQSSQFYRTFAQIVQKLKPDEDYEVDEKHRSVSITNEGIEKVEKMISIDNIYAPQNLRLVHYLEESLRARAIFKRDKNYVVKGDEVFIVDEFTGRLLHGRRYSGGLHQAIEAKERVSIREESRTYAKISIQNYFRLYDKISGMTGTAQTSAEEFFKVYNLNVASIPTNRPLVRKDLPDVIYKSQEAKWEAVVSEVKEKNKDGRPVLLGTTSIEKNELISALLSRANIPHEVLNAKNNEQEGSIIAQAGRVGAVTVATNMAGRGVDIILGGNPPVSGEAKKVKELGGLHVIGTERHEARRIDDQLRGRTGRQGDPGSSQFFLSLDDDLVRVFGGDRIKELMEKFKLPEDTPIEVGLVSKAVASAQAKVEGFNFDIRKHLLDYDDVLNRHRTNVYNKRKGILDDYREDKLADFLNETALEYLDIVISQPSEFFGDEQAGDPKPKDKTENLKLIFKKSGITSEDRPFPDDPSKENLAKLIKARSNEVGKDRQTMNRALGILDTLWMYHLENLEAIQESVRLRAYGQKDPLSEYREESRRAFRDFWHNFNAWIFLNVFKSEDQVAAHQRVVTVQNQGGDNKKGKVGRNDPCPCGSGKKYKKCHGQ